ncbi:MAG: PAS domain S-box protein [Pseudomonadota bacterium]
MPEVSRAALSITEPVSANRRIGSLRAILMLMTGLLPIVIGHAIYEGHRPARIAGLALLLVLALFLSVLLYRTRNYRLVAQVLVFGVIAFATAGTAFYGSIRNASVMGYLGAVVIAGLMLPRRSLLLAFLASSVALVALTYAESSGLLPEPDLTVGWGTWLIQILVLGTVSIAIYTSQHLSAQSYKAKIEEYERRERAELALRQSEGRLRRIFTHSPVAVMVQSPDSDEVNDVNPAFERMYGYSRDEIIGRSSTVLWADPEERRSFYRLMRDSGRVVNQEATGLRKDGRRLRVLLSSEIEDEGPMPMVVSIISDITPEAEAREAARKSEDLFAKAFDFSPINMLIVRTRDGQFLAANAASTTVQGYTPEELVGRHSMDTGTWLNEKDRDAFYAELYRNGGRVRYDTKMQHRSGQLIDGRIHGVLVEIDGEECILASVLNITEQTNREAFLVDLAQGLSGETGEPFFRTMLQHLGRAIDADLLMVGEIGPGQSVTSLAMLLDGEAAPTVTYSLAGTPCDMALNTPDICVYHDKLEQMFPTDQFVVDGVYRSYLGVALRDADGSPIGILNAMWRAPHTLSKDQSALVNIFASRTNAELVRLRRDREILGLNETLERRVSDRTDQLQAANAELESFGYSVSHDLQSPLRSIQGFVFLLERKLKGKMNPQEERLFERVRLNVVRMHELINDLLALARVSRGKLVLQEVDLSALARQAISQEQLREPLRSVRVVIEPDVRMLCDAKFARIVLENLISNAWKYSRNRDDACIEFAASVSPDDGSRMLMVRDNGAGFSMEYSGSLFKPFHRLHHDNEFEGSGIGLATVHRILERHGGSIRAEAEDGRGATFFFTFESRSGSPG